MGCWIFCGVGCWIRGGLVIEVPEAARPARKSASISNSSSSPILHASESASGGRFVAFEWLY